MSDFEIAILATTVSNGTIIETYTGYQEYDKCSKKFVVEENKYTLRDVVLEKIIEVVTKEYNQWKKNEICTMQESITPGETLLKRESILDDEEKMLLSIEDIVNCQDGGDGKTL